MLEHRRFEATRYSMHMVILNIKSSLCKEENKFYLQVLSCTAELYYMFFFSSTEIDDMLRKSTNLLLTRTLSSCLQNLIKKPHIGLTEVSFKINTQNCAFIRKLVLKLFL